MGSCHAADGSLDGVVVDVEHPVVDIAEQRGQAIERVADRFGERTT